MSDQVLPSSAQPFVPTTTRNIERANHLLALKGHPGFRELVLLSQELVQTAVDTCIDYGGWDKDQIVVLKVRMQAAKEHHQTLFAKIQEAVQIGLAEMQQLQSENVIQPKTAQEAIEHGDFVRQRILQESAEWDTGHETRAPGSF